MGDWDGIFCSRYSKFFVLLYLEGPQTIRVNMMHLPLKKRIFTNNYEMQLEVFAINSCYWYVHLKYLQSITMGGGFLGLMISDVRDYYIDNVRFPTL